ncbi:hypothetical protein AA0616_2272 [Komagataeibacter nataicola NRIC 0616]|nr:hypothetical protein AA0616_2272 [Komagataeibacter nataicola NRIC 0616]
MNLIYIDDLFIINSIRRYIYYEIISIVLYIFELNLNVKAVHDEPNKNGIETKIDDVGFSVPSIGVGFFSCKTRRHGQVRLMYQY